jgi:hypothetical protein
MLSGSVEWLLASIAHIRSFFCVSTPDILVVFPLTQRQDVLTKPDDVWSQLAAQFTHIAKLNGFVAFL